MVMIVNMMNNDVKARIMKIHLKWRSNITTTENDNQNTNTCGTNTTDKSHIHSKDDTRVLQTTDDTTASCIPIQLHTQVTLIKTKLDTYNNKFRVNQTNFDKKKYSQ